MNKFIKQKKQKNDLYFDVKYKDYHIFTTPDLACGDFSLAINGVEIEITDEGKLLYAYGLCPNMAWGKTKLTPINCQECDLYFYPENELTPGVTIRIGDDWPVFFNGDKKLLCFGIPDVQGECIEFAPHHFAVIDDGQLKSLWIELCL